MTTDIKKRAWIEKLPPSWRPYAYLGRFDRPIGVWLLLLPGWWSITLAAPNPLAQGKMYALFALGAVVMRAAGCVMNDIWDRDFDRRVGRTQRRPLAEGLLSIQQAGVFLGVLLLIGLCILLQMNIFTIVLGVLSLPLIAVYPLMKRITWWPQAFLGLVFNFGALMGWSAVAGSLELAPLLLYAGCIFWTLAYDTIYAYQDIEDDALIGVKSTARLFQGHAWRPVAVFYALALIFWMGAVCVRTHDVFDLVWFVLPSVYMGFILKDWQHDDAPSCLKGFQRNRDLGLIFLLVIFAAVVL